MKIIARIPLFVALIAVISLTLSGMGVRQGWWTYRFGFQILEWSAYGGLTAAVLAIAAVLTPALRFKALISLAVAMIIGVFTCYMPWR